MMTRFKLALTAAALLAVTLLAVTVIAQTANPASARPPTASGERWWANAVFYQVFVRSFQDSNGDGVGDFKGLTSRLGYLQDLGVSALWLMPIHPSPSYHGYDVTDYGAVNPQYGTEADFDAFLKAAHGRGMKVIIDWVPNHSSREHPWFQASRNPASEKRDWYLWRKTDPGWSKPAGLGSGRVWIPSDGNHYYAAFWEGMPDLNWRNAEVRAAVNGAARSWLARGVDGFRVDAVRYVVEQESGNEADSDETLAWMSDFSKFVHGVKPEAVVVGEAWTDVSTVAKYFRGGQGEDMGFNFNLQSALPASLNRGGRGPVELALEAVARSYPAGAVDAIFTTNHDLARPTYFYQTRYRAAASLLLTLPGTPFLYYGEEIAMPGAAGPDEAKRTPMRWDASRGAGFTTGRPWYPFSTENPAVTVSGQLAKPGSLLNHYRNLIKLRQARPALRVGGYYPVEGGERIFSYVRYKGDEALLVVVNLDTGPARATLDLTGSPLAKARGPVRELTLGKDLAPITGANASGYTVGPLTPGGLMVLEVRP